MPSPKVREPATVTKALERIRTGVIAAAKRSMGSALTLPPISPRDLLEGTCLRFDTEESGALRADQLRQVPSTTPNLFVTPHAIYPFHRLILCSTILPVVPKDEVVTTAAFHF